MLFLFLALALGLALFIAAGSFLPRTNIVTTIYFWGSVCGRPSDLDNLIFFADIAKYSVSGYIQAVENRMFKDSITGKKYLEDLCTQIVANSVITVFKFRIFTSAIILLLFGEACLLISIGNW